MKKINTKEMHNVIMHNYIRNFKFHDKTKKEILLGESFLQFLERLYITLDTPLDEVTSNTFCPIISIKEKIITKYELKKDYKSMKQKFLLDYDIHDNTYKEDYTIEDKIEYKDKFSYILDRKKLIDFYNSSLQSRIEEIKKYNLKFVGDLNSDFITYRTLDRIEELMQSTDIGCPDYSPHTEYEYTINISETEDTLSQVICFNKYSTPLLRENNKNLKNYLDIENLMIKKGLDEWYGDPKLKLSPSMKALRKKCLSHLELPENINKDNLPNLLSETYNQSLYNYYKEKERINQLELFEMGASNQYSNNPKIITKSWACLTNALDGVEPGYKVVPDKKSLEGKSVKKLTKEFNRKKEKFLSERPVPYSVANPKLDNKLGRETIEYFFNMSRYRINMQNRSANLFTKFIIREHNYRDYVNILQEQIRKKFNLPKLYKESLDDIKSRRLRRRKYSPLFSKKNPINLENYDVEFMGPYPDSKLYTRLPPRKFSEILYISKELKREIKEQKCFHRRLKIRKIIRTKRKKLRAKIREGILKAKNKKIENLKDLNIQ